MSDKPPSVQLSFRLSRRTVELLDSAANEGAESRNALTDRLLGEALRLEHHPLIRFHQGASGRRQPLVAGTRLFVHQVMSTLRGSGGKVDETARYFGVNPRLVRAALEYYAEFTDEVDQDAIFAERIGATERSRWEQQQRALA